MNLEKNIRKIGKIVGKGLAVGALLVAPSIFADANLPKVGANDVGTALTSAQTIEAEENKSNLDITNHLRASGQIKPNSLVDNEQIESNLIDLSLDGGASINFNSRLNLAEFIIPKLSLGLYGSYLADFDFSYGADLDAGLNTESGFNLDFDGLSGGYSADVGYLYDLKTAKSLGQEYSFGGEVEYQLTPKCNLGLLINYLNSVEKLDAYEKFKSATGYAYLSIEEFIPTIGIGKVIIDSEGTIEATKKYSSLAVQLNNELKLTDIDGAALGNLNIPGAHSLDAALTLDFNKDDQYMEGFFTDQINAWGWDLLEGVEDIDETIETHLIGENIEKNVDVVLQAGLRSEIENFMDSHVGLTYDGRDNEFKCYLNSIFNVLNFTFKDTNKQIPIMYSQLLSKSESNFNLGVFFPLGSSQKNFNDNVIAHKEDIFGTSNSAVYSPKVKDTTLSQNRNTFAVNNDFINLGAGLRTKDSDLSYLFNAGLYKNGKGASFSYDSLDKKYSFGVSLNKDSLLEIVAIGGKPIEAIGANFTWKF